MTPRRFKNPKAKSPHSPRGVVFPADAGNQEPRWIPVSTGMTSPPYNATLSSCSLRPVAWKRGLGGICLLLLAFIIACGAAATATPAPPAAKAPAAEKPVVKEVPKEAAKEIPKAPAATPVPVAAPKPTPLPPAVVKPKGTLNMGQKELGPFMGHPKFSVNPQLFVFSTAPVGEGLLAISSKFEPLPLLAESWSISKDFTTWTFKLRKGVQFHKGFGEMTSEDVAWSYEQWAQNATHAHINLFKKFWANPKGSVTTPDPYTVVMNTGEPLVDALFFEFAKIPGGAGTWIASKKQSEKVGAEAANLNTAGTGPWEIAEHHTGEFWKMRAVENHWRKTPNFAGLVFWEIPEESARLAGFQTGQLDTMTMAFDSIPLVEKVSGARLLRVTKQPAGSMALNIYGQYYAEIGTPQQRPAYDPNLAWVGASSDPKSPEWERARKVRLALITAIDVDTIMKTLVRGLAEPSVILPISFHPHLLDPDMKWEFNPDKAKKLLAEAGYPKGFSITLATSVRGAPAEVEVCEVIATMWGNIGVDVKLQKIPYATLRPAVVARKYQGATCHGVSPSIAPVRLFDLYDKGASFNFGISHPFLEEIIPKGQRTVDPVERQKIEKQMARFLYDGAHQAALYTWQSVWPVGPKIEEWSENIFYGDIRNINGFEHIRPRK